MGDLFLSYFALQSLSRCCEPLRPDGSRRRSRCRRRWLPKRSPCSWLIRSRADIRDRLRQRSQPRAPPQSRLCFDSRLKLDRGSCGSLVCIAPAELFRDPLFLADLGRLGVIGPRHFSNATRPPTSKDYAASCVGEKRLWSMRRAPLRIASIAECSLLNILPSNDDYYPRARPHP